MIEELNLPFLFRDDKIISIDRGHTTAKKWIVERKKKRYFLKQTKQFVKKEIYDKIWVETKTLPKLFERTVQDAKIFSLYEFQDSKDFDSFSEKEVLDYANKTAESLKKFSMVEVDLPKQDLKETIKQCKEEIEFYFAKREDNLTILKNEFLVFVDNFSTSFERQKQVLLHGDVKPENIIFSDEVCFVDTEEMRYGFFLFNFQYSVQMFFDNRERYRQFFWQLAKSYYDGKLPEEFENNLKFVCIKKFFNRVKMFIVAKDEKGEREFIDEFQPIFEFLKKETKE